eukprot:TRINITY_DN1011_c0_g2_i1.p1 TRINITY_DN1011_c0_g2~~TRINITY_DN1011_c0_g2_i1.p1  ORF type:complete len:1173 (+),score=283.58 TRINITY_DN1011_c0_g2_i1:59-3577(+)
MEKAGGAGAAGGIVATPSHWNQSHKKAANQMVMQLSSILPEVDLIELANCVKRADLNFDQALTYAMDANTLKQEEKRRAQLVAAMKMDSTNAQAAPTTTQAAVSYDSLRKKYRDELDQVKALIDNSAVSDQLILDKLVAAKGDVEKVILLFVEADESAAKEGSTEAAAAAPSAPLPMPQPLKRDKGKAKMIYEDEFDDEEDPFMPSSNEAPAPIDLAISDSDDDFDMDSDHSFGQHSPDHHHHGGSDDSDGLVAEEVSDDEIDAWFEQPDVADIRTERLLKEAKASREVDLFTLQLQEQADKEFAMQLQRELSGANNASNSVYYSASTNPFAKLAAAPSGSGSSWNYSEFQTKSAAEKRREEWAKRAAQAQPAATIVENPALKQFLKEQDERNTMKIMHAGDNPSEGSGQTLRARPGPRLHTILQELKKIEQEIRVINEKKQLVLKMNPQKETVDNSVKQPKTRRGKHTSRYIEEAAQEQRLRSALNRSQERAEQPVAASGEFLPREPLSDEDLITGASNSVDFTPIQGLPAPIPLRDCLTIQDEEIVSLRNAFGVDRIFVSDSIPRRIAINLSEPTFLRRKPVAPGDDSDTAIQTFTFPKPLRLVLIMTLPALYPNPRAPILDFSVRSGSVHISRLLDLALLDALTQFLVRRSAQRVLSVPMDANNLIDPPTMADMVDAAEVWLESNPAVAECARKSRAQLLESDAQFSVGSDYAESLHHLLAPDFKILSTEDILSQREASIARTYSAMSRTAPSLALAAVRVLLRAFGWDEDTLIARWNSTATAPEEREKILAEAGILKHQAFLVGNDTDQREQVLGRGNWECPGCFEDFSSTEDAVTLPCGHFYCKDCMKNYLKIQIAEGSASAALTGREALNCPGHKCKFYIDSITLAALVDAELYSRYIAYVTNAYVEKNKNVSWCPSGRGCEYAISADTATTRMVGCKCGYVFCFSCKFEAHWPAACDEMKWFRDTNPTAREMDVHEEEQKSMQWIMGHTQDCPKCRVNIQKNGGCNHMSCWSCNHNFCWVCLADWSGSHYSCTALRKRSTTTGTEELVFQADVKLGFRSIFHINSHSKTSDQNLKMRLLKEIASLRKTNRVASHIAVCEAILKAMEYLFLCRHVILTTSIVGMFMVQHRVGGSSQLKRSFFFLSPLRTHLPTSPLNFFSQPKFAV